MTSKVTETEAPQSGAALRVIGNALNLPDISGAMGLNPTHSHKAGDADLLRKPYTRDMWMLESPLNPTEPLDAHLKWLRNALLPHYQFLLSLREKAEVDIYCSYSCFSDQNGLTLSVEALRIFTELNIPLGVSILLLLEGESNSG